MRLLETFDGGTQTGDGMFERVWVFILAGGFVGGHLGKTGDAAGSPFAVGLFQRRATSDFKRLSKSSSSCLRSSPAAALRTLASISLMVFSIMIKRYSTH